MTTLIPFLAHRDDSTSFAWRSGRFVTVAEFIADVQTLAQCLPPRRYAINLCRDRYCFAVALAAAMVRGQVSLLPASQALQSLRELQREYLSVCLLVDDEQAHDVETVRVSPGSGSPGLEPAELAFTGEMVAAVTFTSGSTGTPVPSPKKWGALALGGATAASHFGLNSAAPCVVVGTVPPQHMFGLEATIMMALQGGLIMHSERPFFPADVAAALASVDTMRVLVSTPVHLRTLLESDIDLPALRLVISATAPLPVATARDFEDRFRVEVREVYGFTEAGMVATRRTADEARWTLLPGLQMRQEAGRTLFSGGHVGAGAVSGDLIGQIDDQHFEIRGRSADLVNIAGKRTSIGYLNHQLCAIAGVEDGAFFMPDESGDAVTRLTAFVVAPAMTRQQLIDALSQRIDPVFLPRPLHLVTALPRDANGKLPRSELAKLAAGPGTTSFEQPLVVHRSIDAAHPAFAGHFPGDPIVPAVVLLDEIVDALCAGIEHANFTGLTIHSAKFLRPVRPGERMQIKLIPGAGMSARFVCSVDDETAVNGSLTLAGPSGK
jgi:acyl-coenzyme A synthetase/AMP-(fatty) acid ligase/3-hydroxymyristoyl/3-hydroxydecanoyl-(acyl carrier protein) dehydratase